MDHSRVRRCGAKLCITVGSRRQLSTGRETHQDRRRSEVLVSDEIPSGITVHPIESIGTSVSWLKEKLLSQGIDVHSGSRLALALAALDDLRDCMLHRSGAFKFDSAQAAYDHFADANGIDFVSKALHL